MQATALATSRRGKHRSKRFSSSSPVTATSMTKAIRRRGWPRDQCLDRLRRRTAQAAGAMDGAVRPAGAGHWAVAVHRADQTPGAAAARDALRALPEDDGLRGADD